MNFALLKHACCDHAQALAHHAAALHQSWRQWSLAALAALSASVACAQPAASTNSALTVADYRTYLPDSHSVPQALQLLAQSFNQTAPGTTTLQVVRNPLSGSPLQQLQALQKNTGEAPTIMLSATSGLAALDPAFALFDRPYAIETAAQAEAFYASEEAAAMLKALHAHGLHGLAWMENGFRIITADRALKQITDFRELQIRTVPVQESQQLFAALGSLPVSLPADQVKHALASGQLQAQESFVSLALQQHAQAFHRHLWLTQHSYGAQVLLINLQVWQALSASEQERLQHAATHAARKQRQHNREADLQALQQLQEQGVQLSQPSLLLLREMKDATRHLREPPKAALRKSSA
ncbi:TRAP transporter substrate-binding protein DctP [Comamonas sp. NoAH]|uniref:TRAP transporter substrate-binding protein DctP n=1 Tax=Comamonas halotolerans TaxID=3041496 RepID=UPI0024E08795|nr:TRAP transporter substrate-binding protein DctP [Comamonas sp. NoAH]